MSDDEVFDKLYSFEVGADVPDEELRGRLGREWRAAVRADGLEPVPMVVEPTISVDADDGGRWFATGPVRRAST